MEPLLQERALVLEAEAGSCWNAQLHACLLERNILQRGWHSTLEVAESLQFFSTCATPPPCWKINLQCECEQTKL